MLLKDRAGPSGNTGTWTEYGRPIKVDISKHAPAPAAAPTGSVHGRSSTPGTPAQQRAGYGRVSAPGTPGTPGAGAGTPFPRMRSELLLQWRTKGASMITVKVCMGSEGGRTG